MPVVAPPSAFLVELKRQLVADFCASEMLDACKYAVLTASGWRDSEIRRELALAGQPRRFADAKDRARRAASQLHTIGPDEL